MVAPNAFREVMGRFPTGVTVVTGIGPDGDPFGLTVNSFTSVSLDPAMVLVCIDRLAASHEAIVAGKAFAVHILAVDQGKLATRFASIPGPKRFRDTAWSPGPRDVPILDGAVAWLMCSVEAVHEAGDHSIIVGRVDELEHDRDEDPLIFHRGMYGTMAR